MEKQRIAHFIGIASLLCASAASHADEFAYVEPLFKDGKTITPLLIWQDTGADGYPDKLTIAFNVWTAGTTTKLLQTQRRGVATPAIPCASPALVEDDVKVKFMGTNSANRVHMVLSLRVECEEDGTLERKQAVKSVWYSANVTTDGASYAKAWGGWEVLGTNSVDWDADTFDELQLILVRELPSGDTTKARVIYMNFGDGDVEADSIYNIEFMKF